MAVPIQLENLTKLFGDTRAVDHVDLAIDPGELFFLLGPSGCGKTTLLRCIAGFNVPDEGTIRIGERDVTRLPPHERDTGMVFQSYALWPHMSVAQNVAFGLEMRKRDKAEIQRRVDEVLALVKMPDRAASKPNQLSGGQQQRVALARALVIHPRCLLLDEPLSNLDAKLRLEMRSEIRRICKEAELTAVYVTHDQKEALSIADRLAVLHGGKVLQCGRPREVYERPVNRLVANFIGETNFLRGSVLSQNHQAVRIRTAVGEFVSRVALPEPVSEGQAVTLSLRPEVIRLDDPPDGQPNRFSGLVHDSIYLGEVAQHQVRVGRKEAGGEAEFKVFELNPKIVARDGAEPARVWIDPEDVVVLTD